MSANCPSCGSPQATWLGKLPDRDFFAGKRLSRVIFGGSLYRCQACQLKFRDPLEPEATYRALYDNAETETWVPSRTRPDWDLIVAQVAELRPAGGRVLDFGCYTGGLLARLAANNELFGVEVNREAARMAAESAGACVWPSVEAVPHDKQFDIILLADVIEHVPDPRALLGALKPHLADEGAIIITTGDADNPLWNRFGANWWYCFYPEHIAFISRTWAERALVPHGWSIVHSEVFRYARMGPIRRVFERVLASLYGRWPDAYLYAGNRLRRWSGRPSLTSVAGNGASPDHLLIVLSPSQSQ